jgi:hypothetical protein
MNPQPDRTTPSEIERSRQAAAVNHLLGEIGLASGEQTQWWNLVGHEQLGGRTATQAWLAGDSESVRALVESWYRSTRAAGQKVLEDKERLADLRRKLADLDRRYSSSSEVHRTV